MGFSQLKIQYALGLPANDIAEDADLKLGRITASSLYSWRSMHDFPKVVV